MSPNGTIVRFAIERLLTEVCRLVQSRADRILKPPAKVSRAGPIWSRTADGANSRRRWLGPTRIKLQTIVANRVHRAPIDRLAPASLLPGRLWLTEDVAVAARIAAAEAF